MTWFMITTTSPTPLLTKKEVKRMSIQQNIANYITMVKAARNISLSDFAESLDISRAALQSYLQGTGNPSVTTINHLAQKLDIDPVALVSASFEPDQLRIIRFLLENTEWLAKLPDEKRDRLAELFFEIVLMLA